MANSLLSQLHLNSDALRGETVVVTGAGGGIGYEAARALLWLGANVVIAEINSDTGVRAAEALGAEFGPEKILFVQVDVGDAESVQNLYTESIAHFGQVDAVINNATIAVLGKVVDLSIDEWDRSYRVNLRGPVLMAQTFLPGMIRRDHGVFVCVSSTGTAFLGGYETFKTAQVHLANTLDAELEGTRVIAFTIGPGLVPTLTAARAVEEIAPLMGMTVEQFFEHNKNAVLTVEEAGAGFALSILFAEKFRGQEISSLQALKAANYDFGSPDIDGLSVRMDDEQRKRATQLCVRVSQTLSEQSEGWKQRSLFERQWVLRDFKKNAGMPVEEWLHVLDDLEESLRTGASIRKPPLEQLSGYYEHLAELAKGYEKDPEKRAQNLRHINGWRDEVDEMEELLKNP